MDDQTLKLLAKFTAELIRAQRQPKRAVWPAWFEVMHGFDVGRPPLTIAEREARRKAAEAREIGAA